MKWRSILSLSLLLSAFFITTACSSGGGGGGNQPQDPAYSDVWDQMEWDKGTWAE